MATRTLSVVFAGDATGAKRAFSEVEGTATGLQGKLAGVGQKLAGVGRNVAIGAGAGLVAFGTMAIKAALEGERAEARLEGAIHRAGPAFADLAQRADAITGKFARWGFENDEVQLGLAKLTPVTKNSTQAVHLLGLAADIARARNMTLEDATALLVKVQTGHVGLLGRLGIATKDAEGKTLSQEAAVRKLTDLYGGQAQRSADTFAGRLAGLKAQFHNIAEEVGNRLIPIISAVIGWFVQHREVAIALAAIIGGALLLAVGAYTVTMIQAAAATIAATWPILAIIAVIAAVVAAVYLLWTNWDQVWGWIKDHPAIAALITILAAPVAAMVAIVGVAHWLYENWDSVWSAIQGLAASAWQFIDQNLVQPILAGWHTIEDGLGTLHDIWDAIWGGIRDGARAFADGVSTALQPIIDTFNEIVSVARTAKRVVEGLTSGSSTDPLGIGHALGIPGYAKGGPVYAAQGFFAPRGTDTIPAMLSPGEYVLSADVVDRIKTGRPSAGAGGSGGSNGPTVVVNVAGSVITERQLDDVVATALARWQRHNR